MGQNVIKFVEIPAQPVSERFPKMVAHTVAAIAAWTTAALAGVSATATTATVTWKQRTIQ
jgi:hypothetical protein